MTEGVKNFLQSLGLGKYFNIFSAKGFDLETDIPHLTRTDLKETLMVTCEEEREIILYSAQRFKTSSEHFVYEWLRRNSLDHYFVNFMQSGLVSLESVSNIQLPNEEIYDELEIVLPGHQKRLERAVVNLRQEMQRRSVAEKPVTQGWWGKPQCLPQAKFDFLCVEGTLFARHEPDKSVKIDFMVDSGSDVSTVQEKTLESLNLELVGPVYSCGIHGGNHTNLYRAQLQVGNEQMTVEVIASNYDSLGSRIVRHFRHVIDGNRHIWLKGNYRDPIPAVLPLKVPATTKQLEAKQNLLSIENDDKHLASSSTNNSHALSSKHEGIISASKPIPSITSSPSNSSTNSTINHISNDKLPPTTVVNRLKSTTSDAGVPTNEIKSDSFAQNLRNESFTSYKKDSSQGVGIKRTLELSENEISEHSKINSAKSIKLSRTINDLPRYSLPSSTQSLLPNANGQESHTPQQHVLPVTTHQVVTQHIPNNPPLALFDKNSMLRNTDDDIDHMDSDKIYAQYLSSTQSNLSSSCSTPITNLIQSSGLNLSDASRHMVNSHINMANDDELKSNIGTAQTDIDIIHVHSDDDADEIDDCIDHQSDIVNGVVHINRKHELSPTTEPFGRNFIPGNNASSVTISMLDMSDADFK